MYINVVKFLRSTCTCTNVTCTALHVIVVNYNTKKLYTAGYNKLNIEYKILIGATLYMYIHVHVTYKCNVQCSSHFVITRISSVDPANIALTNNIMTTYMYG